MRKWQAERRPRGAVQDGADPASVRAGVPAADGGGGLPQQCVPLISGVQPAGGIPHFSTVSYNFCHRFTEEIVERAFRWILEEVAEAGYLFSKAVFIDGTHIMAGANTKSR